MPRGGVPMKDVPSDETRKGAASKLRSSDLRMGQPGWCNDQSSERKGTRGTETSKYPQEKKTDVMALVAASERAPA